MGFGVVGTIRKQVMKSMKSSSSYSTYKPYSYKPYSYKPKKTTYSSSTIKWK